MYPVMRPGPNTNTHEESSPLYNPLRQTGVTTEQGEGVSKQLETRPILSFVPLSFFDTSHTFETSLEHCLRQIRTVATGER
jgi:hypothetical protein